MQFWADIVRHSLSTNKIDRYLKFKKLEHDMRYQVDSLLSLNWKNIMFWDYDPKMLLTYQFPGLFTFDLFDLLNLIPEVHCYIALVCVSIFGIFRFSSFAVIFIILTFLFINNSLACFCYSQRRFYST